MARTARNRIEESPVEQRKFQVGIYARLSVEGDEQKNESIDTQIEIAKQYIIKHPEMTLYDIYTDLGATGTNFERIGFEHMMNDVRKRNIDCIIVKDLSRFGRNSIETGNYIQKIFPFMKVRFVAVTDSIDTFDPEHMPDNLTVNLKNLVNELYAKDIAKKVKTSRKVQWENGSYTGGISPYGYNYEWNGKIKSLVIEPETSEIVKDIYKMFLDGMGLKQISEVLYERKIHRPSDMHISGNVYQQKDEVLQEWTSGTVKMILTNPAYMGCLIQARTCGKQYMLRTRHDIDSDDYNVHLDTHKAIISEEDFYKVAQKFERTSVYCNKRGFQKKIPLDEDIYRGIIFCGDCGKKMSRVSNIKTLSSGDRFRWYGYRCTNSDKLEIACPAKGISKKKLDEFVLVALEQEFKLSSMRPRAVIKKCKNTMTAQIDILEKKQEKTKGEMTSLNNKMSRLYMQYRLNEITVNEFHNKKKEVDSLLVLCKEQLTACEDELHRKKIELEEKCKFLKDLMKCKDTSVLTREVVVSLIKRIEIYTDYRVKLQFAFCMNEMLEKELTNHE